MSDRATPSLAPRSSAWRAKILMGANALARAMKRSGLRVLGMACFASTVAVGTLLAFHRAFAFLDGLEVVGPVLLVRLLSLFFFALFVMLVMSNVLVAFQALFRSKEAEFWATTPVPPEVIHDVRSPEIAAIAGWAFLFLGTPLLVAYGLGTHAAAPFYFAVPVVLLLFCLVAHATGMLVAVTLVRAFPGLDLKRLLVLLAAATVPLVILVVRAFRITQIGPQDELSELLVHALEGLGRTQYPLLPGYWAAEALRGAALADVPRALFFTWALAVSALFLWLLARAASAAWLVEALQLFRGRAIGRPVMARTRRRVGTPAGGPLRALAIKDALLFVREAQQWSQALLVGVLTAVYVLNLRNLPDLTRFELWGRVAAVLNIGVVLLLISTLTTRFAFPLISLEGRRAWIVLLAPLRRGDLVRQKMGVAVLVALPFGLLAAWFSTRTLGVPADMRGLTFIAAPLGAFALSGLAVGLGALFPDFREDNPARIVSGFGGTVDFLTGLAYVAASTALLGAPKVALALGRIDAAADRAWSIAGVGAVALLSLGTGLIPLAMGRRHVERIEL